MVVEHWNRQFSCETIHPTQKFTSKMQMPCLIRWAWSFFTSEVVEADRGQNLISQRTPWHLLKKEAKVGDLNFCWFWSCVPFDAAVVFTLFKSILGCCDQLECPTWNSNLEWTLLFVWHRCNVCENDVLISHPMPVID